MTRRQERCNASVLLEHPVEKRRRDGTPYMAYFKRCPKYGTVEMPNGYFQCEYHAEHGSD